MNLDDIKIGPTIYTVPPELARDLALLREKAHTLAPIDLLMMAGKYLPDVRINIAENVDVYQASLAIGTLISQKMQPEAWSHEQIHFPRECKHLVLAHGVGRGDNWCLLNMRDDTNRPIKIRDFVGAKVPKGEEAFCVVCSDGQKEDFAKLTGKLITSEGPVKGRRF